jgi:hypothetical protein
MGRKKKALEGLTLDIDLSLCTDEFNYIPIPTPKKEKKKQKKVISVDEILGCLKECEECKCKIYTYKIWKGKKLCISCHQPNVNHLYEQFCDYITKECNNQCAFCNKGYSKLCRFHFDHINMFSKNEGIGDMLLRGEDLEKIIEEAKKCQLLCYSCHSIVTRIEQSHGFMTKKRRVTNMSNKGVDNTEILNDLYKNYEEIMTPIYDKIKEAVRGSG